MTVSIPSPVDIGGVPHTVSLSDNVPDDAAGQIDYRMNAIILSPHQSPAEMRDTVLHEVMHGVVRFVGIPGEKQESIVCAVTSALLMVLRANPALVAYLTATDA